MTPRALRIALVAVTVVCFDHTRSSQVSVSGVVATSRRALNQADLRLVVLAESSPARRSVSESKRESCHGGSSLSVAPFGRSRGSSWT